ncbi:AAA domain [Caudoviricetes sp.]|nr:AAA domain [Caudoviricetes sp.]
MSFLEQIHATTKPIKAPWLGVIYGRGGCGKTWLAQYAPQPFFVPLERGVEKLPAGVGRFVDGSGQLLMPKTGQDFFEALSWFRGKNERIKTIVIDSGTSLNRIFEADIMVAQPTITVKKETIPVTSIADYAFGEGYATLEQKWLKAMNFFELLQNSGFNVLVLTHDQQKSVTLPTGEEAKEIQMALPSFGNYSISRLLETKSNFVYYMRSEKTTQTVKRFGSEKTIIKDSKPQTVLYTRSQGSFFAKSWAHNAGDIDDYYVLMQGDHDQYKQVFADIDK